MAAAAAQENLVPAAVSKRISELESSLNTALLSRTNKGVSPTAAGTALLILARRVLSELDQIPVQLQGFSTGVRGLVRISASMSAVCQFLPYDLESFITAYPDVQIKLRERSSSEVGRDVAENAADVGVYTSYPLLSELRNYEYFSDRLVLCVPKEHPIAAQAEPVTYAQFADEAFISMPQASSTDSLLRRAASTVSKTVHVRMEASSFDAMCVMISCGLGVGLLPRTVALRNAVTLKIHVLDIDEPWARRQFHVSMRDETPGLVAARLLVEHLTAAAKKNAINNDSL